MGVTWETFVGSCDKKAASRVDGPAEHLSVCQGLVSEFSSTMPETWVDDCQNSQPHCSVPSSLQARISFIGGSEADLGKITAMQVLHRILRSFCQLRR